MTEFQRLRPGRSFKFKHQVSTRSGVGEKVTHNINVVQKEEGIIMLKVCTDLQTDDLGGLGRFYSSDSNLLE